MNKVIEMTQGWLLKNERIFERFQKRSNESKMNSNDSSLPEEPYIYIILVNGRDRMAGWTEWKAEWKKTSWRDFMH